MRYHQSFLRLLIFSLLLVQMWGAGAAVNLAADRAVAAPDSPALLSQSGGASLGVAYGSGTMYVGMGPRLYIYNVSILSNPVLLGISGMLPDVIQDVVLVDSTNRVYVTLGEGGLAVFSTVNKTAPLLLGTYDTAGFARGLFMDGNYAYIADGANGLVVLNISNPSAIVQAAYYDTPGNARGVDRFYYDGGAKTYIADGSEGLQVLAVNVSTGEVGWLASWKPEDYPVYVEAVVVLDRMVYMALGDQGVRVIRVSLENTVFDNYAITDTPGYAQDFMLMDTYLYVADGVGGLRVINKDTGLLNEMGAFDSPGIASGLALYPVTGGCYAFLADTSGVFVVTTLDETHPTGMASRSSLAVPTRIAVSGDTAYLADPIQGLRIVNLSNPSAPALTGMFETPGVTYDVAVRDATAYVADGKAGLQMVDITNPSLPVKRGEVNTPGDTVGVALADDAVYLADSDNGLVGITFTETLTGTVVVSGTFNTNGTALDVAVAGGYAYVADGLNGLVIVNRYPLETMTLAGWFDTPGKAYALALSGDLLFLADGTEGLRIFNIGNPVVPLQLSTYDTMGEAVDVAVRGSMVYLVEKDAGVHMVDVSDPVRPRQVLFYPTTGAARGVAADARYVLVGDEQGGLLVFSAPPSSYFLRLPLVMR